MSRCLVRASAIEPLEARIAPATFLVTNGANSGAGSLRDVILATNANPGPDKIIFALDANEAIVPTSALPVITGQIEIDGYSNPGSVLNTSPTPIGYSGEVTVLISGQSMPAGNDALVLAGGNSLVRGIAICGFIANAGVGGNAVVLASDNNSVQGCWMGLTPIGFPDGNGGSGVRILAGATGNSIGGTPAQTNIIVDNAIGVEILSDSNAVSGNFIGTASAGNSSHGILISGVNNNIIGPAQGGVGNYIIGNGGAGVRITGGVNNSVLGNNISGNGGLGIDLGATGVTANDAFDLDSGANNLQNFPVITSAITGIAATRVSVSFTTTPFSNVRIEVFSSAAKDPSGFGEGERFLGAFTVTSGATGLVEATGVLDVSDTAGRFLSATATIGSNTSEFSLAATLIDPPSNLSIAPNGRSATYTDADGDIVTLSVTRGTLSADRFGFLGTGFLAEGSKLTSLDLSNSIFAGAVVKFAAKRGATGDGFVNVGQINATGVSLAALIVPGDLQQVFAGAGGAKPALGLLSAHSIAFYTDAQPSSFIEGNVNAVKVRTHFDDAKLTVQGNLKSFVVGGSVVGQIYATGRLGSATIVGDVEGVSGSSYLRAGFLGSVKIGGDLVGSRIIGEGVAAPISAAQALAIRSVTVLGDVVESRILAGHNLFNGINAQVQIGSLAVRGNWILSDAAAGVRAGADLDFGTGDDALALNPGKFASRIAKIVIGGQILGTFGGTDTFGFVAQQIGSFRAGTVTYPLSKTTADNLVVGPTFDVRIRELP